MKERKKYYYITSGNRFDVGRDPLEYYTVLFKLQYTSVTQCLTHIRFCSKVGEFISGDYAVINEYIDGDVYIKKIITLKK